VTTSTSVMGLAAFAWLMFAGFALVVGACSETESQAWQLPH